MFLKSIGSKRAMPMRSPFFRALVAALLTLGFLLIVFRAETVSIHRPALGKSGFTSLHREQPIDHQGNSSPIAVPPQGAVAPTGAIELNCSVDTAHLAEVKQRYNLDDKFQYLKRYVRFTRKEGLERKSMTRLSQKLLNAPFKTVDLAKTYGHDACDEPLEVDVTTSGLPSTVNASDYMFGVSTTYQRFMDPKTTPINEWVFWLTDSHGHSNGAKLILMLLDARDDELQEVANLLGDVGVDVDVYHSGSSLEMAVRYLALVPTLTTHPDAPSKKWLVTCDDDTFFPSMHGLMAKMDTFNHTQDLYVGTLSEDSNAVERHGSQAFGGAGVFLSLPLARKITEKYSSCATEQKVLESNSGYGPQGDILLRKCIYENTETRLTMLWDLWQLDIVGDAAGFYEWGIKPLSLHHYRASWHTAKPDQFTKIAHTCGEDCSLQRFQTADDFVISGFSIANYPEGAELNFVQMEKTLQPDDKNWNFDFMFGPQRRALMKTGRKISWDIQESEVRPDGSVLQTYTRKKDDPRWVYKDGKPMSNIDGIIELVWIPS